MSINKDELRKKYNSFSKEYLEYFAINDSHGLDPDALQVLKEVINERNLSENIIRGLETREKTYSFDEIRKIGDVVLKLPCPHCNSQIEKLKIAKRTSVRSFFVLAIKETKLLIGCSDCLKSQLNRATIANLLLGIWSPHGFFYTMISIFENLKMKKFEDGTGVLAIFDRFIYLNIPFFEANKYNENLMKEFIKDTKKLKN